MPANCLLPKKYGADLRYELPVSQAHYALTLVDLGVHFPKVPAEWSCIATDSQDTTRVEVLQLDDDHFAVRNTDVDGMGDFTLRHETLSKTQSNSIRFRIEPMETTEFAEWVQQQIGHSRHFIKEMKDRGQYRDDAVVQRDLSEELAFARHTISLDLPYASVNIFGRSQEHDLAIEVSTQPYEATQAYEFLEHLEPAESQTLETAGQIASGELQQDDDDSRSTQERCLDALKTVADGVSHIEMHFDDGEPGAVALRWPDGEHRFSLPDFVSFVDPSIDMPEATRSMIVKSTLGTVFIAVRNEGALERFAPSLYVTVHFAGLELSLDVSSAASRSNG